VAERPVFLPQYSGPLLVKTVFVPFHWSAGMALVQKRRSIAALHQAATEMQLCKRPLEISSKSAEEVGVSLSAFYLGSCTIKNQSAFTVETMFQSSKVFERGGPFRELLHVSSRDAKKEPRLQTSGRLVHFDLFGEQWQLEPKTAFYDWVYINTLIKNPQLVERLSPFDAFTDIEFNPDRSINCQAYSLALYKALAATNQLEQALKGKDEFLKIVSSGAVSNSHESTNFQPRLM
jgi:hypothetical protein